MLKTRSALPLALVLGLAANSADAWGIDCRYSADRSATIDTAGADRIQIVALAGDLTVRPGNGPEVLAKGRACASSEDFLQQTQLHAVREGTTVRVFVQVPQDMKGIGFMYASLDLTVDVPTTLPVEVTDTSGDILLQDVRVSQVTDSSGDIVAHGLLGDVQINDSSGDLEVDNAAGTVTVSDSSGDVEIRGAANVIVLADSSGDLRIEHVAGDVRIDRDSSGDIKIADVGRNVEVLADSSGDVSVTRVKGTVKVPK